MYPPRDPQQKQYYAAMKQFAESGGPGMSETLILPTATMSGFYKASVHLYVTLLGLAESTGPNKEIVVRYRKADQGKKQGKWRWRGYGSAWPAG